MAQSIIRPIIVAAIAVLSITAPAQAQSHFGIRAGASVDPDQFFFGGHVETRPLAERLTFRPNVEVGVGDDVTLVAINLEFAWSFSARQRQPWHIYVGGGPGIVISSHDTGQGDDNGDVGGGFNLLIGAQHRGGLFGELKVGFIDSPDVKFTVGYAFK